MSNDQQSYELKQASLTTPNGRRTALLIIDPQNDFIDGGSFPYPNSLEVIANINAQRNRFKFNTTIITGDNHPADHVSFASTHLANRSVETFDVIDVPYKAHLRGASHPNVAQCTSSGTVKQTIYPFHCIADSPGAKMADLLETHVTDLVILKGSNALEDSPNAFYDDYSVQTGLLTALTEHHIAEIFICGFGANTTVLNTALTCARFGFLTTVVSDCVTAAVLPPSALVSSLQSHADKHNLSVCQSKQHLPFSPEAQAQLEAFNIVITQLAVLKEPREDLGREAGTYLSKQTALLQQLCAHLVYSKPEDPIAMLKQKLQEVADSRLLSSLSLMSDADIEAVFSLSDPNGLGFVSGTEARSIIWQLGLDAEGLLVRNEDRFTCAELKILARRAMERRRHE